ncbi:hypothetical protein PR048_016504 [Dryococelus australis]|uniref:PiggyBac transposable element-derived protein domain-containing protein n=1 Tax=Dryococelus australis TaxID=614101 RepID=A0ABQ9HKH0_9NEOP|nr:hypothetical protein PR048_016504 [Dryococelus australis]
MARFPLDRWELLVTSKMVKTVVHFTNVEIKRQRLKYINEARVSIAPIRQLWNHLSKISHQGTHLGNIAQLMSSFYNFEINAHLGCTWLQNQINIGYYVINAILYNGKEAYRKESLHMKYVCNLSVSIHGTGNHLTVDNYFMSVPLADVMLKAYVLTVVGTLRKNKREILSFFLPSRKIPVGYSQFAFESNNMLVSHCPKKKGKRVLMLSTMHYRRM